MFSFHGVSHSQAATAVDFACWSQRLARFRSVSVGAEDINSTEDCALYTTEAVQLAEELKTRAETVVTDKISEELGVEVDSLDNIEDTLKEELTNRAAGELLKLLGGN